MSHERRPRFSITPDNVAAVRKLVERDRRTTVAVISEETGISVGSVHTIIRDHLGFRKISARWVPRLFTQENKNTKVEVCQTLLAHFENQRQAF